MALNNANNWLAGGTIAPCSFVKQSTAADNKVLQAGANERAIGITTEDQLIAPGTTGADTTIHATAGYQAKVFGLGDICQLIAGTGGFTRGDLLESESTGYGITAITNGVPRKICAVALESAAAAAKGRVMIVCYDMLPSASGSASRNLTLTALGTAQSSSPTAAQILGGFLTQTSATGAGAVTLPTGTAVSAAFGATPAVGDYFRCVFANLGGGQTLTITGATGTTVISGGAIATAKSAELHFINTAANAWSIAVVGG